MSEKRQMDNSISRVEAAEQINRQSPDEKETVDILRYAAVVWKHRLLVLAGLVIGLAGAIVFYLNAPDEFSMTYQYANERLRPKEFRNLTARFYSAPNLQWFGHRLQERQMPDLALAMIHASVDKSGSRGPVRLEVWPKTGEVESGRSSTDEIQKMVQSSSELLLVQVSADSKEKVAALGEIVRENMENVLVLHDIINALLQAVSETRSRMAEVEENRFTRDLALSRQKSTLERLKQLEQLPTVDGGAIALQFSLVGQTEFLPLSFHISSTEKNIVELEEQARWDAQTYEYHRNLLGVQNDLLGAATSVLQSSRSPEEFVRYVSQEAQDQPTAEIRDYLAAYMKRLENRVSTRAPVTELPSVRRTTAGRLRTMGVIMSACLIAFIGAAFVAEAVGQGRRTC